MQRSVQLKNPAGSGQTLRYRLMKRVLDLLVATLVLLCLSPLFLVCALLVRRSSAGPVLFRQRRVGQHGREFTCLKFRSMYSDADPAPHQAYVAAMIKGEAAGYGEGDERLYKLVDDPRVTPIGRWLRRTSLDELPQLSNVLRGEMSLVGPRPPIPYELENYDARHLARLAVKPGITGLWQVSGRSRTSFEDMVRLDLEYIQHPSILFDCLILVRTIPAVVAPLAA